MQKLLDRGIATKRGIMCAHLEPAYMNEPWHTGNNKKDINKLNASCKARDKTIILPLFHQMETKEQNYIVKKIIKFMN